MCAAAPPAADLTCTLGLPCILRLSTLPRRNSALGGSNLVWLGKLLQACQLKDFVPITGLPQPLQASTDIGDKRRAFHFGTGIAGVPGIGRVCWAALPTTPDIVEMG